MTATRHSISVTVNGETYERQVKPRLLLADFLRHDLELFGTHVGCEHGVCGVCTVLFNGVAERSCLIFAVQADGAKIQTIEGLAEGATLHPIQRAFRTHHGLQCGFCTPGMLMTALELLRENPDPSAAEVKEAVSGVLCRCTGYQQIIDSILAAAQELKSSPGPE